MNNQIIGFTIGILLLIIGMASVVPALLDWQDGHENYKAFFYCSIASFFFGGALILSNHNARRTINVKQTFLLTTLSWLSISIFASFPLFFCDLNLSFVDAFFEAVSGITTTGSTVLSGLDQMSRGVLFWRSATQWIGGIGIIAFAIVILPFLRVGGMSLFQAESSDRSEKIMPRTLKVVSSLLQVYILLTIACAGTFYMLGMGAFEAINHAMTTVPTGGYSTHDASFGFYDSPALHYAAAFFMLAGGLPFVLYVKFLFKGHADFMNDEQFKALIAMLVVFITVLSVWVWTNTDYTLGAAIQYSTFNIISVITTTGFATTDYTAWGGFAAIFFLFITFMGACAGSTSGGIKVMRLIIMMKVTLRQLKTLMYPNAAFTISYHGRRISNRTAADVMGFIGVFVISNAVLTILLTLCGLDFATAISGSATAFANVGPGIGDVIGPAGNFASLPDSAKWLLAGGMLLGRLEIMTVLVLLRVSYWRS